MPWMSANLVTAPGGIEFAATAIAGYWESLWGRMNGTQPTTRVSITHPAPGQDDLPATGWERSFQAGSSRSGGGARNRIVAVLTHARPYVPPGGGPHSTQMPPGTMTITRLATGEPVPLMAGYPRSVPYGGEAGHHLIDVQPANDLDPCVWYEVQVGIDTPVLDARGLAVQSHSWQFRTECALDRIDGAVFDAAESPVPDVLVLAYRSDDGFVPTAVAATDAEGAYSLTDLPDGEYRLAFVPPAGSGLGLTWYGPAPSRVTADPISVPIGASAAEIVLPSVGGVSGLVTGADGQPVDGATVLAFGDDDRWVPTASVATAPDGTYQFSGLPVGAYRLAFRPPAGGALAWFEQSATRAAATPVTVGADARDDVDHQFSG
jgi:hypothetical protein